MIDRRRIETPRNRSPPVSSRERFPPVDPDGAQGIVGGDGLAVIQAAEAVEDASGESRRW